MVYIGIDPGKKGGISIINCTYRKKDIKCFLYSDELLKTWTRKVMYDFEEVVCFVEQVHALPQDGVKGSFAFGKSFGYILGVLETNKIPYQLVPPQTWKKEFSVTSDKQTSIDCAKRLFPDVNLLPTERCRKESDGMAESLLIAEWGRRHYEGINNKHQK